ncbi:MAG: tripartite tricarboxylate transporter permease [Anaerolineae bacterium]|nr:tripartite tricarboxylate transporter permease [Anaerolineae bacterium]
MEYLYLVPYAIAGTLIASTLALAPALHVYNIAGIFILIALGAQNWIGGDALAMLLLGMIIGYAMLNTVSAIFLGAPDDSTIFIVLPGQKYLLMSRGYEAAVLTGIGALGGVAILMLLAPFAVTIFVTLRTILLPHLHWILAVITCYMLLAEWPKGGDHGATGLARLWDAWKGLGIGLLTFVLSGILGIVLMYKSPVPLEMSFQNLLPAFVGLFAVPWVLENILSGTEVPKQHISKTFDAPPGVVARGIFSGALGGLFAAFFPVVTGGIGGYLAGHATAQRDDRVFIISQGASKFLYYVGAFCLFFLPAARITKGGMAGMLATIYTPQGTGLFYTVVAMIAVCGVLSFGLLLGYSRLAVWLVERVNYRYISLATLGILFALVYFMTGWGGVAIMLIATPIGGLPILWGSRRLNCLGVILVPITLNLAGLGPTVAAGLGILR